MLPVAIGLIELEQELLERRVLNTKVLPPIVGDDVGTVRDYLLNVWHWDAAIFLLFLLSVPGLGVGIWLLARPRPGGAA
jgi:hypothetical protein